MYEWGVWGERKTGRGVGDGGMRRGWEMEGE